MGNLLLAAPAGTGKSEYLLQKAGDILCGKTIPDSRNILALSFKRNAADELYRRVVKKCGVQAEIRFESYTFDGFAKLLVDRFGHLLPDFWRPSADYDVDTEILEFRRVHDTIFESVWEFDPGFDVEGISPWNFCHRYMTVAPLPFPVTWQNDTGKDLGLHVWRHLLNLKPSLLNFPMINALAELIVRLNPQIKTVLHDTYGYIFLDEFQDTSFEQYELFKSIFLDSNIPVIAAGDECQRIMLWANAMPDAFEKFKTDFAACEVTLTDNFRSEPLLVDLQNRMAMRANDDCMPVLPNSKGEYAGHCFVSVAQEADFIVEKIRYLLDNSYRMRDIAVLVRDTGNELTARLCNNALVRIRDESKLHKLFTEPVVELLFDLWSAAFTGSIMAWDKVLIFLTDSGYDELLESERLFAFIRDVRGNFARKLFSPENFSSLITESLDFFTARRIKAQFPRYRQGNWLDDCLSNLLIFAGILMNDDTMLPDGLNLFKYGEYVTLTTIQQCKMCEFKVIFVPGLEKADLMNNYLEERNGIFIACSRAREKVFFSASEEYGKPYMLLDFFKKCGIPLQNNR